MFLAYFFNACLAHNLYITFYTYKNDYHKRIYVYKITALVLSIIVLLGSILFNNKTTVTTVQFTVAFYPLYYLGLFYFAGGCVCFFIILKIIYVHSRQEEFFSFLNQGKSEKRRNLITLFVKKQVLYLISFLICYLPNNIILLIQIFSKYRICDNCEYYAFVVYLISASSLLTFIIKLTEPYMKKYVRMVINFLTRQESKKVRINLIIS